MSVSRTAVRRRFVRASFFFGYLVLQLWLLIRAQGLPDFLFGFQMFNASSELKIGLFRRVHGARQRRARLVPVRDGSWQERAADGTVHVYRWRDRVRDGVLGTLDRYVHASYGLDAQLFRLQFALDDALSQLPASSETEALLAVVETRKNGVDAGVRRLTSERR